MVSKEKKVAIKYIGTNSIRAKNYVWDWQTTETVPLTLAEELCESDLFIMVDKKPIKKIEEKSKIEVEE